MAGVRYLVDHGALAALRTARGWRYRLDDVEALRLHREAARSDERSLRRRTIGEAEAARRLGLSRPGLLYQIHRGALPAVRTPHGWRIQPEDLQALRLDREYLIAVYGDIRGGVAGAPRGNLNTVTNGARIRRLNRALRDLAPARPSRPPSPPMCCDAPPPHPTPRPATAPASPPPST